LAKQEQRFYDSFMLVLGIFTGLILGIIFMKAFMGVGDGAAMGPNPTTETMVEERIRPYLYHAALEFILDEVQ
jgi:hypothetical protein